MYEAIVLNCFRYLGMKSFDEVDYTLLSEYHLRMKAYSLQRLDRERDMHMQAYLNMVVQATKERGKKSVPIYPTFRHFFDYEKQEQLILGTSTKKNDKYKDIKKLVLMANKKGGKR